MKSLKLSKGYKQLFAACSFVLSLGMLSVSQVQARPGDLDASFGGSGTVITDHTTRLESFSGGDNRTGQDAIAALKVQPDGKTLAVGYTSTLWVNGLWPYHLTLTRYNVDGSIDTTFGTGGSSTLTNFQTGLNDFRIFNNSVSPQADLTLQADGKILVFGEAEMARTSNGTRAHFLVARYNTDGSLDPSFGRSGVVTTDFTGSASSKNILKIFVQSDNKIVAVGRSSGSRILIARYLEDGSLDLSYGVGGKIFAAYGNYRDPSNYDWNQEVVVPAMQADNKLVFAGFYQDRTDHGGGLEYNPLYYKILYRLNAVDGNLDESFGTRGKVIVPYVPTGSSFNVYAALDIQSDGKILAAGFKGHAMNSAGVDALIERYNVDGSLDTSFADRGSLVYNLGTYTVRRWVGGPEETPYEVAAKEIKVLPDGKIAVVGNIFSAEDTGSTYRTLIMKLNWDGSFDTSFGNAGRVVGYGVRSFVQMHGLAIKSDDCKIVVGGVYNQIISDNFDGVTNTDFILNRYENTCIPVATIPTLIDRKIPTVIYQQPYFPGAYPNEPTPIINKSAIEAPVKNEEVVKKEEPSLYQKVLNFFK